MPTLVTVSLRLTTRNHRDPYELFRPFGMFPPPSSSLLSLQTQKSTSASMVLCGAVGWLFDPLDIGVGIVQK